MKKLIIYAIASGFLFTACQKDESENPETTPGNKVSATQNVSPVPATFVKKVMVEEFTSTANGNAPIASRTLNMIVKGSPTRVFSAGLHIGDIMGLTQSTRLLNSFTPSNGAVPCATVDRTRIGGNIYLSSTQFSAAINGNLSKPAYCGLAINSSINGRSAQIDVHTGFAATMPNSYKVTTYLIEDRIGNANPSFYQANNFANTAGSPFFNMSNPLTGYVHYNALRRVISEPMGDAINSNALVSGGSDVKTYTLDLPAKYGTNSTWKVISFITDDATNEILNVQMGTLGTIQDWN